MCADESSSRQQFHVAVTAPDSSAVELLAAASGFSKQQLKKLMQSGAVWLTQGKQTKRLRRAKKALPAGTELHLYYDQKVQQAEIVEPQLLADEGDYSVWVKACGMMSQGSKWGDQGTIARWAEQHLQPQRPAFIVHRLDRATRGLILVAHSKSAARALSQLFEQHQLEKTYQIIVHGEHQTRAQPETVELAIDGKPARSHFSHLEYDKEHKLSLLEVKIESGRKHQIRIHAASIGLPVVGDRLHGNHEYDNQMIAEQQIDLQLCAVQLEFICPLTQVKQNFTLPEELRPQLSKLS